MSPKDLKSHPGTPGHSSRKILRILHGRTLDRYRFMRNKTKMGLKSLNLLTAARVTNKIYERKGIRVINCLGESNSRVFFGYLARHNPLKKTVFRVWWIRGATAYGLTNPNSRTRSLRFSERTVKRMARDQYLLFIFGEADCTSFCWLRARSRDTSVDEQLQQSLANYRRFLEMMMDKGFAGVLVCAVPFPANKPVPMVRDSHPYAMAAPQEEELATRKEQTELTVKFNQGLRELCSGNQNLMFLDIEDELLDRKTGLVDERFLYRDREDHHLDPASLAPLWVAELKRHGFE